MPLVTLTFQHELNVSVQIGDVAYKVSSPDTVAGFTTSNGGSEIGLVKNINNTTFLEDGTLTTSITITIDEENEVEITTSDYIFFRKSDIVNMASLVGYFGSVKLVNNATNRAEMFAVSCNVSESSK